MRTVPTILIEEQGLRDGLQNLPITIPTQKKVDWINKLTTAGIQRIQVGSFVHPKLVPTMADTDELFTALPKTDNTIYTALVLNVKGVERAINCGVQHLAISLSASNTHSIKNMGKDMAAAKAAMKAMIQLASAHNITVRGGIQCAFGCRYEGAIDKKVVYELVEYHLQLGVNEIALADSTGMGNPKQIKEMMTIVKSIAHNNPIALHLHNTENKGYANMYAALEAGITQFDTAFGGLGGCPFIKNATGNIATEDAVNMLHQIGYATNIDIAAVSSVSMEMEALLQSPLPALLPHLKQDTDLKFI